MTHTAARYRVFSLLVLVGLSLSTMGCNRWVELKAGEPMTVKSGEPTGSDSAMRVPAILSTIAVSQNGSTMAPPNDLEHRVLDTLADTQLFSRLVYPGYADLTPEDQHVRAKLSVALFPEPHAGAAAWKGIVIGASMFVLAPILPLEYEYGARMTLELEREDGTTHQYTVHAEGVARYHLFGATHLAVDELKAQVLDTCLTQLRTELVKDRMFVQAGYLARNRAEPRAGSEFTAIPTTSLTHRTTRTISILRSRTP